MKTTILITFALISVAYAGPLYVYERHPNEPSGVHHGLATTNGKTLPVLIEIYGYDSIQVAQEYGRDLVRHNHSFAESKAMIIAEAQRRYANQKQLVRWFEHDAAEGYDAEAGRKGK